VKNKQIDDGLHWLAMFMSVAVIKVGYMCRHLWCEYNIIDRIL